MCRTMARNLVDHNTIHRLQTHEMENQYNNLNRKLDRLQKEKQTKKKTDTHHQGTQFYTTTVNLTNISFSQEGVTLQ